MLVDKTFKTSVIASIFASVLVIIFLEPIIKWIWNTIQFFSTKWYSGFMDSLFEGAAKGDKKDIELLIYFIIFAVFVLGMALLLMIYKQKLNKLIQEEKIKFAETEAEKDALEKDALLKEEKGYVFFRKTVKPLYYVSVCYTVFFVIAGAIYYFQISTDVQLNTSFNQRLNAISPYIEDFDYKKLKSKWALMKNRKDYNEINSVFEEVAKKNNIELPKLLLK